MAHGNSLKVLKGAFQYADASPESVAGRHFDLANSVALVSFRAMFL